MAKYYRQALLLEDGAPGHPPVEPLTALEPMKRARAVAVMRAQDKLAGTSRRIVCRFGMQGSIAWRVPNTDPDLGLMTQDYPDATTEYVCGRAQVELTPGCMYRLYVWCVPAGATQYQLGDGTWGLDSIGGSVLAEIDWHDAASGSEATEHELTLPPSQVNFGAENTSAGGLFESSRLLRTQFLTPPDIGNVDETARFSRHITADLRLKVKGGARVVDALLVEEPFSVALEADDASNLWTSHIFGHPKPGSPTGLMPYPLQRGSETTPDGDPRRGTWHTMDVAAAQQLRLGPALVQWTAFSETDATPTSTLDPLSFTNTWKRIPDEVATSTYDAAAGGWSVSSGGYARSWDHNNDLILRKRTAVIPVIARVYGSMSGAGVDGTVRLQTSQESYIDVTLNGTTDAWFQAYGWLEVGVTPEQPRILQAFGNSNNVVVDMSVESFAVHYGGQWAPRV